METIKKGSKGDAVKQLQKLLGVTPADGIFGTMTECAVKKMQLRNGLYPDGIVGEKTWKALGVNERTALSYNNGNANGNGNGNANGNANGNGNGNINITQRSIGVHMTPCSKRVPRYLVIHYTAGRSSGVGAAEKVRQIFLKREASADFVVDDTTIMQINPDPTRKICWAVGDKTNYRAVGTDGKLINNSNCISIEICSNLKSGASSSDTNHEGWYFTEASINNAVKLSKYLMQLYGIPADRVLRHYDVTHKNCPGLVGWNDGNINDTNGNKTGKKNNSTEWEKFKMRLR